MERRNAWLSYKEAEETEMENLAKAYREFLDKGKTERECVAEIVKEAEAAGYESLESKLEKGEKIKAGDKVYAVGMKKIVALVLALALTASLTLTACNSSSDPGGNACDRCDRYIPYGIG